MSLIWIIINSKLLAGVSLINSLSIEQFTFLLQHVLQSENCNFTTDQLTKLEKSFKLNSEDTQLLIQSVIHILKQSSKIIIKPTVLQKELVENLKFHPSKAEEFVKTWTNRTKETFGNLENLQKLDMLSWELNLQTVSSVEGKKAIPTVKMKLGLIDVHVSDKEKVEFELGEQALYNMYNVLENIQNRLDFIQRSTN